MYPRDHPKYVGSSFPRALAWNVKILLLWVGRANFKSPYRLWIRDSDGLKKALKKWIDKNAPFNALTRQHFSSWLRPWRLFFRVGWDEEEKKKIVLQPSSSSRWRNSIYVKSAALARFLSSPRSIIENFPLEMRRRLWFAQKWLFLAVFSRLFLFSWHRGLIFFFPIVSIRPWKLFLSSNHSCPQEKKKVQPFLPT